MKAVVRDAFGSPDVLRLEEIDKPDPKDDELLVGVRAATVEDFTRSDQKYDLLLDIAGSRSWSEYKRVLNPQATYVMVGRRIPIV